MKGCVWLALTADRLRKFSFIFRAPFNLEAQVTNGIWKKKKKERKLSPSLKAEPSEYEWLLNYLQKVHKGQVTSQPGWWKRLGDASASHPLVRTEKASWKRGQTSSRFRTYLDAEKGRKNTEEKSFWDMVIWIRFHLVVSKLNLSSDCLVTNEIKMTNTLLHHAKGGSNGEKVCERQTDRSVCGGQGMHRCMLAALLFSS